MDESAWLTCDDPEKMLAYLRGKASDRKLRLFACACVRRILSLASVERSGWVVEVAERQADALASDVDWAAARDIATKAGNNDQQPDLAVEALFLNWSGGAAEGAAVAADYARSSARDAAWSAVSPPVWPHRDAGKAAERIVARRAQASASAKAAEREIQVALLRDSFGTPFKPTTIAPVVLAWQGSTVVKLAAAIYEGCRWEDMPLLGDALEDAGCTDQTILDHCRGPGPHARGCHVVDLLLGKS